jgi:hypothetical protein
LCALVLRITEIYGKTLNRLQTRETTLPLMLSHLCIFSNIDIIIWIQPVISYNKLYFLKCVQINFVKWSSYNNAVVGTCSLSFETYQKVIAVNCCLDWVLCVWQSLEKGDVKEIWRWEHENLQNSNTFFQSSSGDVHKSAAC